MTTRRKAENPLAKTAARAKATVTAASSGHSIKRTVEFELDCSHFILVTPEAEAYWIESISEMAKLGRKLAREYYRKHPCFENSVKTRNKDVSVDHLEKRS